MESIIYPYNLVPNYLPESASRSFYAQKSGLIELIRICVCKTQTTHFTGGLESCINANALSEELKLKTALAISYYSFNGRIYF